MCSYIHFRDEGNQGLKRSLEIEAVLDLIRFIGTDTPHAEVSGNNFFFFFLVMPFQRTFD